MTRIPDFSSLALKSLAGIASFSVVCDTNVGPMDRLPVNTIVYLLVHMRVRIPRYADLQDHEDL